jgi:hypothetical protein
MRRLLTVILPVAAGVIAVVVPPAVTGASSLSATTLLNRSLDAAAGAGSVEFVDRSTSGKVTQQLSGAISAPAASETITGNGMPFAVELIDGVVYVQGSANVLETALKLSPTQANPVSGKWISVTSTDSAFSNLTGELTITQSLNEFTPTGPHVHIESTKRINGHTVIPIVGTPKSTVSRGAKGSVALLVSSRSPHLPVGGSLVLAKGKNRLNEVAVFKNWGATVSLIAPTGAVPITSIVNG